MEVHAHAHTERKKWTHYLWEFLMLFLAVFCGFLAEYKLEHIVEHNREKEYMQSMAEDLQQDTAEISRVLKFVDLQRAELDSLLNQLEFYSSTHVLDVKKLYQRHFDNLGANVATFSERTLSQLKNAGGLRLIRIKSVADSISIYDSKIQYLSLVGKTYDGVSTDVGIAGYAIFDNRFFRANFTDNLIQLITADAKKLREYSNRVFTLYIVANYYYSYLSQQKELAKKLIELIRKEYHLK
jgi:hypothetical protein